MSDMATHEPQQCRTTTIEIDAAEQERETALRQRFDSFWKSTTGTPREVYDTFISGCPLVPDVVLDAVDEKTVRGWWVRPAGVKHAEPTQAILYLHGGGYVLGSAKAYRGFASQLASRTGVAVLVLDYPLAPEATLPVAPTTALAAWHWLVQQGFEKIAIVGDSAGGGLSLVTLAELTKLSGTTRPVAGAVFSPWTDLAFTGASMTDPDVIDPLIGFEYLQGCARKYLGQAFCEFDPLASPLYGDVHDLPPLFIQVGSDERLRDDSTRYAQRAADAGVSVELEVWNGMHHVFQLDVAHLESSRNALDRVARFLVNAFHQ